MVGFMTNRFDWLFTYATFWGLHIGYISLFIALRAGDSVNSMNIKMKKRALRWVEVGTAYSILVTLLFWTVLAKYIYTPDLGWHGYDLFIRIHMLTLHCVPFVTTMINLTITKISLLTDDWWIPICVCLAYSVVDCIAVKTYGYALYPGWDWTSM